MARRACAVDLTHAFQLACATADASTTSKIESDTA